MKKMKCVSDDHNGKVILSEMDRFNASASCFNHINTFKTGLMFESQVAIQKV